MTIKTGISAKLSLSLILIIPKMIKKYGWMDD